MFVKFLGEEDSPLDEEKSIANVSETCRFYSPLVCLVENPHVPTDLVTGQLLQSRHIDSKT